MKFFLILALILLSMVNPPEVHRVTDNETPDFQPSILEDSKERLWVVWTSKREGNWDIYYRIYDSTWSEEYRLTKNPYSDSQPCILEDRKGIIWIFWSSTRTGVPQIYCRQFDGTAWNAPERVTETSWNTDPAAAIDREGKIVLVWIKEYFVWCKVYDGQWGEEYQLAPVEIDCEDPEVCIDSRGKIWVMWAANREITYRTYTGKWSPPGTASEKGVRASQPAVAAWGTSVVLFYTTENGIEYRTFRGKWQGIKRFETAQKNPKLPSVCYSSGGTLYVAWCESEGSSKNTEEIYVSTLSGSSFLLQFSGKALSWLLIFQVLLSWEVLGRQEKLQPRT